MRKRYREVSREPSNYTGPNHCCGFAQSCCRGRPPCLPGCTIPACAVPDPRRGRSPCLPGCTTAHLQVNPRRGRSPCLPGCTTPGNVVHEPGGHGDLPIGANPKHSPRVKEPTGPCHSEPAKNLVVGNKRQGCVCRYPINTQY